MQQFPRKITVSKIVSSRYVGGTKPTSWDKRVAGLDTILSTSDETLPLLSDGGQSPPQPGWVIMLTAGDDKTGYLWSLYGMSSATK